MTMDFLERLVLDALDKQNYYAMVVTLLRWMGTV